MSQIRINIMLPPNAPRQPAKRVSVEIWDASLADAPSILLATKLLHDVALAPNGTIEAVLEAPAPSVNQVIIARAHVSMDGSGEVKSGDFLTTRFVEVPQHLGRNILAVPVSLVA